MHICTQIFVCSFFIAILTKITSKNYFPFKTSKVILKYSVIAWWKGIFFCLRVQWRIESSDLKLMFKTFPLESSSKHWIGWIGRLNRLGWQKQTNRGIGNWMDKGRTKISLLSNNLSYSRTSSQTHAYFRFHLACLFWIWNIMVLCNFLYIIGFSKVCDHNLCAGSLMVSCLKPEIDEPSSNLVKLHLLSHRYSCKRYESFCSHINWELIAE